MNVGDVEVGKPLIVREGSSESQILQVTVTADLTKNRATLRYESVDTHGKVIEVHANCTTKFEDITSWTASWSPNTYLIEGRIEALKEKVAGNKADQISRRLAYKLFATLVQYDTKYQGMEEVILDSANFEATARVRFQTEDKDGKYFVNPRWIDSVAHLSGFILNGSDATDSKNYVYISHGWKSMRLARRLDRSTTYTSYVKMQPAGNNVMAGDVYVMEGDTIIGVVGGLKFQRIPRKILNTFLPPGSGSVGKPAPTPCPPAVSHVVAQKPTSVAGLNSKSLEKTSPAISVSKVVTTATSLEPTKAANIVLQAIQILAQESELPLSELQDDCEFLSLGIDSLLSLQISGKIREELDIDIPSSLFLEYPTIGQFKLHLQKYESVSGGVSTASSSSSSSSSSLSEIDETESNSNSPVKTIDLEVVHQADQPLEQPVSKSGNGEATMTLFRTTIAEQMAIPIEEVVGSNDLLSLGMDSLMSICILGTLREKTDLTLPSTLFQNYPSIDAIEQFLNLGISQKPTTAELSGSRKITKKPIFTPATPTAQAVSILMQGKAKTASKTLFLFPDGSGSATSYASLPPIDPSIVVYGLNCPFMTNPSKFTMGIPGVASLYLAEVRRRQPHGPYHLGGWSAGGIVAYEVTQQLIAAGERVESMILFDSPCPIKLEALPSRLHHFFAEIGLLGGEGQKPPAWLLPHFAASIRALSAYEPCPIADKNKIPKTLAIWARHGVCRYPGDPRPASSPDDPKTMKWLLENRTDFDYNGWDALLGKDAIETRNIDGNHFTIMRDGAQVSLSSPRVFEPLRCDIS